jgi:putative ABC transport system permease protein
MGVGARAVTLKARAIRLISALNGDGSQIQEMNKLIFANLVHRPLRSIISVLAVAIEVIMILSIVGVFMGILDDQKERTNGIGADLMLRASHASEMNGMGGATIPIKNIEAIRTLPHVVAAAPVIMTTSTSGAIEILYGIDYPSFDALRPFVFLAGGPFKEKYDVIIDDVLAKTKGGMHVGDTLTVMNQPFRICGIVESGKGGRKMLPIYTMGEMMGAEGKATLFYVKVDDHANENLVIQEIHATRGLEDYPAQTMEDWNSMMTPARLPGFNIALYVVTCIAVIVGFLVIFQSMYTAVLERTREIGILKSMGASRATIVGVVLRETAVMAVAGVVVGIVGVFGVRVLLGHVFPTLHFEISGEWLLRGTVIAFVGSVCGAFYPAWMAARKDAIDALAYE